MQVFGSVFNDTVQSSPWQPWMPDQPDQGYFHELLIPPDILQDGYHLTNFQGSALDYQSNRLPPLLTPTHRQYQCLAARGDVQSITSLRP
jgi:hypothetical protein